MAKLTCRLRGRYAEILAAIEKEILEGSVSATLEDSSDFSADGVRCSVRVFERYSWAGGNRLSMNVTLFGNDDGCEISVITAGGSQAMFFKVNTWGEESFLRCIEPVLEKYRA